jgi:hypothetical protein
MTVQSQPIVPVGRSASRLVYLCARFPNGLSPRSYQKLIMRRPELRGLGWELKRRVARQGGRATLPPATPSRERGETDVAPLTRA